jgi:spermidine/putrescine transport system substrate-binding protein
MIRRLFLLAFGLLPLAAVAAAGAETAPKLAKTLYLFNWADYINPEVLKDFEKEFGVRVIEDRFASNEDLIAKLAAAGGGGYDVAVPSDYAVRILARQGLLTPLNHANLPNLKYLETRFRHPAYDPSLRYAVPYLWGVTGLGYSRKATSMAGPPTSWDDVFNPDKLKRYRGRVSMLNDMREVIGAALIYLGHSPNTTDPSALAAAKRVLLAQKPFLAKYDSEAYEDSLAAGETVIAHGWSGEIFLAQKNNPDIAFAVPKEGTFLFVDNLVIPKGARSPYTAEVFINYLLRPEVAAKNAAFLRYPTPNEAALTLIDPKLEGPRFRVPKGVRLYSIEDLGQAGRLYEQLWTELKAH